MNKANSFLIMSSQSSHGDQAREQTMVLPHKLLSVADNSHETELSWYPTYNTLSIKARTQII